MTVVRHWDPIPGVAVPDDIAERLAKHQRYRVALPRASAGQMSLWHATCTHRSYNLTCEQFEDLLVAARFACQRCGEPVEKFCIDHDHRLGDWGVRGLLCSPCNTRLGQIECGRTSMDELTAAFLASPYSDRRPPLMVPVKTLQSLLIAEYQTEEIRAARAAGWTTDNTDLRHRAVIRRKAAYKAWHEQWLRTSGYDRYVDLIRHIHSIRSCSADTSGASL
ncbi:endonuclease domain-containing protein [Pseudonocardia zijingensis]|uniref:Rieske domain-containing protein n=1 Tax=Pseudonocardia zijingensis TaxID=153376 RepID=A0ABP3YLE3_9PSEU